MVQMCQYDSFLVDAAAGLLSRLMMLMKKMKLLMLQVLLLLLVQMELVVMVKLLLPVVTQQVCEHLHCAHGQRMWNLSQVSAWQFLEPIEEEDIVC